MRHYFAKSPTADELPSPLTPPELSYFNVGKEHFEEAESITDPDLASPIDALNSIEKFT